MVKLEHFLSQLKPGLQLYLCDKRVKTIEEAAVYADDYVLVRTQFRSRDKGPNRPPSTTNNKSHCSNVSLKSKTTHITCPSPAVISQAQTPTRTSHKRRTQTPTCTDSERSFWTSVHYMRYDKL